MSDYFDRIPTPDHRLNTRLATLVELIGSTDDPEAIAEFHEEAEIAGEMMRDHIAHLVRYIRTLEASEAAILHEVERLQALRVERVLRAERIREVIKTWMINAGHKAQLFDLDTLRVKANPPKVIIMSEDEVPKEYMKTTTKTETKPDKKAIAEALKNNVAVAGCYLETSTRLEID